MHIAPVTNNERLRWNEFIRENYPPVGAFMQTWEWGDFKENWGKKIGRYFLFDDDRRIAAFMIVEHPLPLGFSYGYVPRGPIWGKSHRAEGQVFASLRFLRDWLGQNFTHLIFIRLEPPTSDLGDDPRRLGFIQPDYYVQPRYNHVVNLVPTEEEILSNFHPSTRSNINRGRRRGVVISLEDHVVGNHYQVFQNIACDTIARNGGKNIYPGNNYFSSLLRTLPPLRSETKPEELSIATFAGYQNSELAAIHFVLFFGDTATYLYGASSTAHLASKVTTCLHFAAMQEAKRRGLRYYDLGGVDESLWPTLTKFKRQFRGEELSYLGNLDLPLNPILYRLYIWGQKLKRFFGR